MNKLNKQVQDFLMQRLTGTKKMYCKPALVSLGMLSSITLGTSLGSGESTAAGPRRFY